MWGMFLSLGIVDRRMISHAISVGRTFDAGRKQVAIAGPSLAAARDNSPRNCILKPAITPHQATSETRAASQSLASVVIFVLL